MPQKSTETLVEERLALLKEITERRNVLLRQMFHMIRHRERNLGSVFTLDSEESDLPIFLRRYELNKDSIESGSILHLRDNEPSVFEDPATAYKSTSKGKPHILRRTTRSRFRPQESSTSKSSKSTLRTAVIDGGELGHVAERTLPVARPFSSFPQYHEDSDEGPDELDLLGSPSTPVIQAQVPKTVHIGDFEAMVTAHEEEPHVTHEPDRKDLGGQRHEEEFMERSFGLEEGTHEKTEEISQDGQPTERLLESPVTITIDGDADAHTATVIVLESSIPPFALLPDDADPATEEKGGRISEDEQPSHPVRTADSPMRIVETSNLNDIRGSDSQPEEATQSLIEPIHMMDIVPSSDSYNRSPKPIRSQADSTLTVLPPAQRPIIILPAEFSVPSEPGFNLDGATPHPPTPSPPSSPVQPRHQFEREYVLPQLKELPLEYNRKVRSAKLQRKREKGRERNDGKRDKDNTRDDWYPLGLNRWAATISANPVWKRVTRTSKCLSTREWAVAMSELRLIRALDRIDNLKSQGNWSFRQPKKHRGVGSLTKTHLDYLMDEMKWMRIDFREERKWKIALAYNLSTAVLEWHAAGNWAERVEKGICIGRKRSWVQKDEPEVGEEFAEESMKLETEEPVQSKASLLEVDYGSDDDDDDDESVVDQQDVLDILEPAALIQDALDVAPGDGNWIAMQDVQPKAEDVEDAILVSDGKADILVEARQDTMDVDGMVPDIPKLKVASSDPILGSNSAAGNNDIDASTAQAKSPSKYASIRDSIIYSKHDKLSLGPDDFHNLVDDSLLPPSDLSAIFPDLQPLGLFDPSSVIPSTNEGKKRSEKRSERDDPTKRSEDTTYTKLFPAGEFMFSKPTLLGPLHPSKFYKDGQWVMEESAVFPDSDSSSRLPDNSLSELFDSRSSNSPASVMALQLQAALLKEKDPRKRGAEHIWSANDDALLKSFIDKYPNNWALISECFNACRLTISIDRRTPRDCLERWKEKWGPEIRQRPGDSPMVTEDSTPASSQMTTRGVKRLASVSISTPSTMGVIPGSEPRKRRRHQLVQESIRKASKKRAESMQKALANQRKPPAVHETHAQYSKMPKHTPAELSRLKAEKEARDLQDLQLARRRQQEELTRQGTVQGHRMNVPEQPQVAQQQQLAINAGQRANGGITQNQVVPQIRNQVNISQQQRTGTPSMPTRPSPQQILQAQQVQQLRTAQQQAQQQAQQTLNQAQSNVSGNGATSNAQLATPHVTRDITSSPAHVSPPHGASVMTNVVNSPRPPSAQAHVLLQGQVPGTARGSVGNMGSYFMGGNVAEQLQAVLRIQMTPPNGFPGP